MNLRLRLVGIALAMMLIGTLPIWLLYAGFAAGGGLGFLAILAGLLLSPMVVLCVAGWKFLGALRNQKEFVVMGWSWGNQSEPAVRPDEDDVLDAEFEKS